MCGHSSIHLQKIFFLRSIEHAITEGFIRSEHRRLLTIADAPTTLLDTLGLGAGRDERT